MGKQRSFRKSTTPNPSNLAEATGAKRFRPLKIKTFGQKLTPFEPIQNPARQPSPKPSWVRSKSPKQTGNNKQQAHSPPPSHPSDPPPRAPLERHDRRHEAREPALSQTSRTRTRKPKTNTTRGRTLFSLSEVETSVSCPNDLEAVVAEDPGAARDDWEKLSGGGLRVRAPGGFEPSDLVGPAARGGGVPCAPGLAVDDPGAGSRWSGEIVRLELNYAYRVDLNRESSMGFA
ncbi:hypothetical protein NL676_005387 [Syzygium grande]|nr:hypothetical protein NL676_005387 [Syzygium grande]